MPCGMKISLPSFFEVSEAALGTVNDMLRSARVIEFCRYASQELREKTAKIQKIFDESKERIFLTCMSIVAACLDPAPFFGAMAVGAVSNFIIEGMHGTLASPNSLFLDRAYEVLIAQTSLVAVNIGCKAVQSVSFQYFPHTWKEGAVSSMISGVIAGATLAAFARRVYAFVMGKISSGNISPA
jgi:hypothetical protein